MDAKAHPRPKGTSNAHARLQLRPVPADGPTLAWPNSKVFLIHVFYSFSVNQKPIRADSRAGWTAVLVTWRRQLGSPQPPFAGHPTAHNPSPEEAASSFAHPFFLIFFPQAHPLQRARRSRARHDPAVPTGLLWDPAGGLLSPPPPAGYKREANNDERSRRARQNEGAGLWAAANGASRRPCRPPPRASLGRVGPGRAWPGRASPPPPRPRAGGRCWGATYRETAAAALPSAGGSVCGGGGGGRCMTTYMCPYTHVRMHIHEFKIKNKALLSAQRPRALLRLAGEPREGAELAACAGGLRWACQWGQAGSGHRPEERQRSEDFTHTQEKRKKKPSPPR